MSTNANAVIPVGGLLRTWRERPVSRKLMWRAEISATRLWRSTESFFPADAQTTEALTRIARLSTGTRSA